MNIGVYVFKIGWGILLKPDTRCYLKLRLHANCINVKGNHFQRLYLLVSLKSTERYHALLDAQLDLVDVPKQ